MRGVFLVGVLVCAGCSFEGAKGTSDGGGSNASVTVEFAAASTLVDEGSDVFEIEVRLSAAAEGTVTVDYAFTDGSAMRDVDWTATDGTLTFSPGETTRTINATILPDAVAEGDETFQIALASPTNANLGSDTHVVTINSAPLPRVSFMEAAASGGESLGGTVTVVLEGDTMLPVTVDVAVGGSASSADYMFTPRTVTFMPGEMSKVLMLGVVNDPFDEDDEALVLTLANPTGALLGMTAQHDRTIVDNDSPPMVSFQTPTSQTLDEGAGGAILTVELSIQSGKTVMVPFSTAGSANGSDFVVGTMSPLTFAPGETTKSIAVAITDDTASESSETAQIVLGAAINATTTAPATYTLTITDNEPSCYATGNYQICVAPQPSGTITLPGSIDTDSSPLCGALPMNWLAQGQPDSCFIYAGMILVPNTTLVTGGKPLVLVGDTLVDVSGRLDVSSRRNGGAHGAGFNSKSCGAFTPATLGADANGGDGGAGGTFLTEGGDGGGGNNAAVGGVAPNAGAAPMHLQAGCDGQTGGVGTATAGAGGFGGGVVYLASAGTIRISGTINASGAAGASGGNFAGGGGGGSGGMIELRAPTVNANGGILMANGGGGSAGSDNNSAGVPGVDPNPTMPTVAAPGGSGPGGAGGKGFALNSIATSGAMSNKGGGGGGGGGGFIESSGALGGATVSAGLIIP